MSGARPTGARRPASRRAAVIGAAAVFLASLLIVLVFALWARGQLSEGQIGIDDASIYFRYARNIVEGYGIVWNPGGERVEGATSPLWTLVCATAFATTTTPEQTLFWINVFLLSLGLTAWSLCQLQLLDVSASGGPALRWRDGGLVFGVLGWCLASCLYVPWLTITLLETGLWGSILLLSGASVLWLTRSPDSPWRQWAFSLALVLVAWTRPEGLVVSAALLGFVAIAYWRGRPAPLRARPAVRAPLFVAVAANAGLLILRRLYFGFWLPNTYYAKVDPDVSYNLQQGWLYFHRFLEAYPLALLAVLGAMVVLAYWLVLLFRTPHDSAALYLTDTAALAAIFLLLGMANGIYVGGDHFAGFRFFQPYWPFAFTMLVLAPLLVASWAVPGALPRRARAWFPWTLAFAIACSAGTYALGPFKWTSLGLTSGLLNEFHIAELGRVSGTVLNEVFVQVETPSVGVITSGGLPFAYRGVSYDLLGLNNVAMAHAARERSGVKNHDAFVPAIFYQQAPDLLAVNINPCPLDHLPSEPFHKFAARVLKHIHHEERFRQLYAPVVITSPGLRARGAVLCLYAKRSYMERVQGRLDIRLVTG